MIKFTIPKISQSLNVWQRQHFMVRNRIKKAWVWEVKVTKLNGKWPEATTKQKVVITSYRKRRLDQDNFIGGAKPLVDALTKNKLIFDDSPDWVDVEYRQEIDGKNTRTEIEIKDFAYPGHGSLIARHLKETV